jgi:hypothetical protein
MRCFKSEGTSIRLLISWPLTFASRRLAGR